MNKMLTVCAAFAVAACAPQEQPKQSQAAEQSPPAAAASAPADVPAGAYTLDKSHASLIFRVDHLGFSNYTARFKSFDAQLQFDPKNFAASSVTVTVDPRSLDLESPPPGFTDTLLGEQWLNVAQHPGLSFRSTQVEATGPTTMRIRGDLSLHGVVKPVTLDATFNGGYRGHPMDPHARIGFSAHGTFNRSEFGVAFGVPEPGSKMGVSDAVEVLIEAEFSGPPLASAAEDAAAEHK